MLADLDRLVATLEPHRQALESERVNLADLPRTEAIELVLKKAGRGMSPVEIWRDLRDGGRQEDPKMEVQVTTYDLWRRGRLAKLGRGTYCHPSHVPAGIEPLVWTDSA